MKHKRRSTKTRPANEITEQEICEFLAAIKNFRGYPKLRDLGDLLPSMSSYKVNVILRYLQRSNAIVVDNDGYITWIRKEKPESLTLADVADIEGDLREFLARGSEN